MATTLSRPRPGPSDTWDHRLTADEQDLMGRLDALYDEGKKVRDRWRPEKDIEDDLKLYRGEVGPKNRDPWFECNFIRAFTDRQVSQLTDNRPTMRIEPRKLGLTNVAKVLDKVIRAEWEASEMQRQTYKVAHNAATTSSAGLYTGWDPIRKEIVLETLRLSQVVFDPAIIEAALVGRGEYLFVDRERPCSELAQRFPGRGALVAADAVVSESKEGMKRLGILGPLTDLLRGKGSSPDALPRAKVRECLVVDRQRGPDGAALFPFGRVIIKTNELILWDGPNYYWDGQFPVDWYDWGVDPEHPYGFSGSRELMRMQLAFNAVIDGLIENQMLTNIIRLTYDFDGLDDATVKKFKAISSSLILQKRNRNAAVTVDVPPSFGADKIGLARFLFTMAQLMAGVPDVTLGNDSGSLQSGLAVEGLQEGANLMTRARASRLEDFYMRVGQKLVSRIFQFMPSDRVISLLGPTGAAVDYAISRQEFFTTDPPAPGTDGPPARELSLEERQEALRYLRFTVSPGSSAPGSRLRRTEMAFKAFTGGLLPGLDVLETMEYPDAEAKFQQAQQESAKRDPKMLDQLKQMMGRG